MSDHRTCQRPDRHEPKLKCGYPLPCPHRTVIVDTVGNTITIPTGSIASAFPLDWTPPGAKPKGKKRR